MRDIVKLALRLFIFAFVAAALLGITNEVTKGPIEQQKIAAKQEALNTVFPGCSYQQIDFSGYDTTNSVLEELFVAKDEAGQTVGYALTASPQGYGGPIPLTVGVSVEGYITYIHVGALQETAGLGSRVGDADFKNQFVGVAADPNTIESDVSLISGATISSSAALGAIKEMLVYTSLAIEPHAGDKEALLAQAAGSAEAEDTGDASESADASAKTYDVTGFAPFKVAVEVDADGKIVSVTVPENNETPGYGADLIADTAVFDALVGQDIATAQIDAKAGVTLTSTAINDALKQAAADFSDAGDTQEAAIAGDPYTVKGMNKFTLYVEVADGKIVSVTAPNHSETAGYGADMLTEEALAALVGQDIATAQVDVKAGVTLTSNAINEALKQAAAANGFEPVEAADTEAEEEAVAVSAPVSDAENVYEVTGFAPFKVAVEVDEAGKIVSVSVPENSETAGFGADLIADTTVFDALVGQDIATAQIDVKAGVTLTSNAINEALKQAAKEVQ